jgi:hypothetical protein
VQHFVTPIGLHEAGDGDHAHDGRE